jgi:hypothetical protein
MPKEKFKYLVICLILLGSFNAIAQDNTLVKNTNNSIHFGCATVFYLGMYSINYERAVVQTDNLRMLVNAGFGGWYAVMISRNYFGYSVPLSLNNLIGSGSNFFELDLGVRYIMLSERSDKDIEPYFPICNMGYRHQKPNGKGLIFRAFIGLSGVGIGVGKAF